MFKRILKENIIKGFIKEKREDKILTCEKVLGGNKKVIEFSQFADKNALELELLAEYLFTEYWKYNEVSRDEIKAYKKAIDDMINFFDESVEEAKG